MIIVSKETKGKLWWNHDVSIAAAAVGTSSDRGIPKRVSRVSGNPFSFVNGSWLKLAWPAQDLNTLIEQSLTVIEQSWFISF